MYIKGEKRSQIKLVVFCVLTALSVLLICSKNSFLYPFNDWPDINIFHSMGKGMVYNKVPYVDLMDQKGPYLYALAAISYLFSKTTFYGYFLFEIVSLSAFLYYSNKLIKLYCKYDALWILPILGASVVCAKSFVHGGSIEELCLGIFAYAMYTLLEFLHDKEKKCLSKKVIIINAFWAGILFWSKFTLVGIYIGWVLVVLAVYIWRKNYKEVFRVIVTYLVVVLMTTLPWIVYFVYHNAFDKWIICYLWNNIFEYSSEVQVSILNRVVQAIKNALRTLKDSGNWSYSLGVIVGGIGYVCMPSSKVSWIEKIGVALLAFGMALGIFIGGTKHDYYGLPLAIFIIFGAILLQMIFERLFQKLEVKKGKCILRIECIFVIIFALIESFMLSPNVYLLKYEREEMPQYRFAAQIQESEDQSLLNYAFLDGGFYTVLDQVPGVRYFCMLNVNRGEILAEQTSYVEQQLTQWLVTWKAYEMAEDEMRQLPIVSDYYDLVDLQYFFFEGDMRTYALYKRKPR